MQDFSSFVRLLEIRGEIDNILSRYEMSVHNLNLPKNWKTVVEKSDTLFKKIDHRDRNSIVDLVQEYGGLF